MVKIHAGDLLSKRAELTPHREALYELHSGKRYHYAALNARANQLGNFLRDGLGIQTGDRVSILAYNNIAYIDLLYGVAKIGAIFAPLNWRLVVDELIYIVRDCRPRVLICGPEFIQFLERFKQETDIEHYLTLEGVEFPGADSYEERLTAAADSEPERPSLGAESAYCLLYTSGTTGRPKGAVIPHRQVVWNCINTVASWGLTEQDVSPVFLPLFHAGGLFAFISPLFYLGGRIVLARSFDAEESLQVIEQERCSVILGVPTLFQMWMKTSVFGTADFSAVRWFISGGAPCPESLMAVWREAKGVVFRQGYGLTEVGPNCFSMTDEDSVAKSGAVGKPIFHSQMRIIDEREQDVDANQVGQLIIAGPHVCSGYWQNPEASAQAIKEGWFHTGDMARKDAEGYFYLVGRYKDMIISGGENIYAAEVEAVFLNHADVAEAALIAQPDERLGEVGLMVVVPRKGSTPSQEVLLKVCDGRLARFKIPKRVVFVDALPYSPYGKVEKSTLKKQILGED